MSRRCIIVGKSWKLQFHEREHESMKLVETHSYTSERPGKEAGNVRQQRERKEGLASRGREKTSTKAIALSRVTWVVGRESVYGKAK